jgi:hypothetical protein
MEGSKGGEQALESWEHKAAIKWPRAELMAAGRVARVARLGTEGHEPK